MRAVAFLCTIAFALSQAAPAVASEPWQEMTVRDLTAIHDVLAANHAGPVDPANPHFKTWLEDGLTAEKRESGSVSDIAGYRRALQRYANGFRDGHIAVVFNADYLVRYWPGFSVRREAENLFLVTQSEEKSVPPDAEVVECDGQSLEVRLRQDIAPLFWNAGIPHELAESAPRVLIYDAPEKKPSECTLRVKGNVQKVALNWQRLPRADATSRVRAALGRVVAGFGLRDVDGVMFVSVPSMVPQSVPADFFAKIEAARPALLQAKHIVLDVRGNSGGWSSIGERLLRILYGDQMISDIAKSFDWTVDWRVSPGNLAEMERQQKAGIRSEKLVADMRSMLAQGGPLVRDSSPATPLRKTVKTPFAGQVYLLTDGACASACLDFADVARRLPGVVHIGQATSGDAIYIDNRSEGLPSGLASLSFGMKVYRNRVRANNQWYDPAQRWPGGTMTDEAVARWIKGGLAAN
jgi:hypothetical protein